MFELSLMVLAWGPDPIAIQRPERQMGGSAATIVRPAAKLAEPPLACAFSSSAIADPHSTVPWLRRWEQAACNAPEMIRSQREEFRRRLHDEFNEHTAAAVEQLSGRVKEIELIKSFDWRIAETNGDRVCLEAIPRDQVERLFYGSLRISLHVTNGTAETIVVVGRNQVQRIVWQADSRRDDDRVQLVQFEDVVPPAPSGTLRTAASRVDELK